jgi:hypothetical protein
MPRPLTRPVAAPAVPAPLTLAGLLAAIDASAIPATSRRAVRSDVEAVLSQMVQHERKATSEEAEHILATEDVRPLLARAERFARTHFRRRGKLVGRDRNAGSRVKQAIRALAPSASVEARPGVRRDYAVAVDPSWRPLFAAEEHEQAWRGANYRRGVEIVATVLAERGYPRLADLPADPEVVHQWLLDAGVPRTSAGVYLSYVRRGVRFAVATGAAPADTLVWRHRIGRDRRGSRDWQQDPDATLKARFPVLHDEWMKWAAAAAAQDTPPRVIERKRFAMRWLAMALEQLDEAGALATLSRPKTGPLAVARVGAADLGLARVQIAEEAPASVGEYGYATDADATGTREVPLVNVVGEYMRQAHPARGRRGAAGEVSPGNLNALRDVWDVAAAMARPRIVGDGKNPDRIAAWGAADAVVREWLVPRVDATSSPGMACRNKGLLTDHLILSELAVYGLPWVTSVRLPALRDAVESLRERGAGERAILRATFAYEAGMIEWLVLAHATADPLRISNMANARVGTGHTDKTPCEIDLHALWTPEGMLAEVKGVTTPVQGAPLPLDLQPRGRAEAAQPRRAASGTGRQASSTSGGWRPTSARCGGRACSASRSGRGCPSRSPCARRWPSGAGRSTRPRSSRATRGAGWATTT